MSQLQKTIPTGENFDWSQIFNKTYLSKYFFDDEKNNRMIPFSASEGSKTPKQPEVQNKKQIPKITLKQDVL